MSNYNDLTLLFGPSLPEGQDTLPIAYISSPNLSSDVSIAALSAERYVSENYPHLATHSVFTPTSACSGSLYVSHPGTTISGSGVQEGGYGFSYPISLDAGEDFVIKSLSSPIRLTGMYVSEANSWHPAIEAGVVWREHIIDQKEVDPDLDVADENQPSWLIRSGLRPGDSVYLIYSVPESRYGTEAVYTGSVFPGSGTIQHRMVEQVQIANPHQFKYFGDISYIESITVNGVTVFPNTGPSTFDGSTEDGYVDSVDKNLKLINVKTSTAPDDIVFVTYYSYANFYNYHGFRDFTGVFYPIDCNPEYGHYICDAVDGWAPSSTYLLNAVTIYGIPTAYMVVSSNIDIDNPSMVDMQIRFESAFSWGETHFVRHMVGLAEEGISPRGQDGPSNTWGHAVFGRNYYDENVFLSNDIFSNKLPSLMPIGRVILSAPASVRSIAMADIRQRGGGVPEDFPFEAIDTESEGLDTLRGYWDLGINEGVALKVGGIAEYRVVRSLLDTYTYDEIYKTIESVTLPGVEIVLNFVDAL